MNPEHLRYLNRPRIADLAAVVDELLERATECLWQSVQWDREMRRADEREAYGLWWGAFITALEMNAWDGEIPEMWCFAKWKGMVLDAASEHNPARLAPERIGLP